ncbi:MAG: hypothetical protein JXA20_11550, partial [Spirochaetes bacterium]|nr:hypothetical protein [Spirochaetota bacterium]
AQQAVDAAKSAAVTDATDLMRGLVQRNRLIVTIMIVTTMVLGAFLYYYLLRLTHRISGPIYVVSRIMRDVMEGRTPDARPLRKDDEFQEFYAQFTEMMRQMERRR